MECIEIQKTILEIEIGRLEFKKLKLKELIKIYQENNPNWIKVEDYPVFRLHQDNYDLLCEELCYLKDELIKIQ